MSDFDVVTPDVDYDVPELRGKNGSAFMDGLERHLKFTESKHVKEADYEIRKQDTLQEVGSYRQTGIKGVEGLGQLKAEIPAREFFRWRQDEGDEIWDDKHFVNSFLRDNSEYDCSKYYTKSFI